MIVLFPVLWHPRKAYIGEIRLVIMKLVIDALGYMHILEHSFELICELAAALVLELGDHGLLSIV